MSNRKLNFHPFFTEIENIWKKDENFFKTILKIFIFFINNIYVFSTCNNFK